MSLTDVAVRAARPGDNPQRMFDGGGLYLEVAPSGSKYWRWKYCYAERALAAAVDVQQRGS